MPNDKPIKIKEHRLKDGTVMQSPADVKREHARRTGQPLDTRPDEAKD